MVGGVGGGKRASEQILGRGNGMCKGPEIGLLGCISLCWSKADAREMELERESKPIFEVVDYNLLTRQKSMSKPSYVPLLLLVSGP